MEQKDVALRWASLYCQAAQSGNVGHYYSDIKALSSHSGEEFDWSQTIDVQQLATEKGHGDKMCLGTASEKILKD